MTAGASTLGLYFLDVGQGDCTFIVPPAGAADPILVDCNDAYVAERFVANHRIKRLRAVVASHLDRDHIRGLVPFLETFFAGGGIVDSLYVNRDRPLPAGGDGQEIALLLDRALAWDQHPPCAGFSLERPDRTRAPQVVAAGPDWTVDIVLPFYGDRLEALSVDGEDPNGCSAVVQVTMGGRRVIVSGDATLDSWERLRPALGVAAVVRVPHHGGELGSGPNWRGSAELYRALDPEHAVISVGTNNAYGHPASSQIDAMRAPGRCRVRCTQLTPRCHPRPAELRGDALAIAGAVEWPYRHRAKPGDPKRSALTNETPCAGSMVVWLDATGAVSVEPRPRGDHDQFLVKVQRPLCQA